MLPDELLVTLVTYAPAVVVLMWVAWSLTKAINRQNEHIVTLALRCMGVPCNPDECGDQHVKEAELIARRLQALGGPYGNDGPVSPAGRRD